VAADDEPFLAGADGLSQDIGDVVEVMVREFGDAVADLAASPGKATGRAGLRCGLRAASRRLRR